MDVSADALRQRPVRLLFHDSPKHEKNNNNNNNITSSSKLSLSNESSSSLQNQYHYGYNNSSSRPPPYSNSSSSATKGSTTMMDHSNSHSKKFRNNNNQQQHDKMMITIQKLIGFVGILLILVPWIQHSSTNYHISMVRDKLRQLNKQHNQLVQQYDTYKKIVQKKIQNNTKMEQENIALLQLIKYHGDDNIVARKGSVTDSIQENDFNYELYSTAESNENQYLQRIDEIEKAIKSISYQRLSLLLLQEEENQNSIGNNNNDGFNDNNNVIKVHMKLKQDILQGSVVYEINNQIQGDSIVIELYNPHPSNNNPAKNWNQNINYIVHPVDLFTRLVTEQYYHDLTLAYRADMGGGGGDANLVIHSIPLNSTSNQYIKDPLDEENIHTNTRHLAYIETAATMNNFKYDIPQYNEKYSVCFLDKGPQFYIKMGETITTNDELNEICFGRISKGSRAVVEYIVRNKKQKKNTFLQLIGIQSMHIIAPNKKSTTNNPPIRNMEQLDDARTLPFFFGGDTIHTVPEVTNKVFTPKINSVNTNKVFTPKTP